MRLSFVGELGWELHIPRPACVPVYRAVMAAGAKHGLVNAGYRAIDSLSIEKGAHRSGAGRGRRPGRCCPQVCPLLPCHSLLTPSAGSRVRGQDQAPFGFGAYRPESR